jgi:hypothetical protein
VQHEEEREQDEDEGTHDVGGAFEAERIPDVDAL